MLMDPKHAFINLSEEMFCVQTEYCIWSSPIFYLDMMDI